MYFLNANQVARDLKTGALTETGKVKYFLADALILQSYSLFMICTHITSRSENVLNAFRALGSLAIVLFGIYYCFNINHRGDNKNFIERIVCIGFPLGIKVYISGVVLFAIFACVVLVCLIQTGFFGTVMSTQQLRELVKESSTWNNILGISGIIWFLMTDVLFYYLLSKKIAYVSGVREKI